MNQSTNPVACVAFPMAISGLYDYEIPSELSHNVRLGSMVHVELRHYKTWGVVLSIKKSSTFPNLKPVLDVRSDNWSDKDSSLIRMYEWMASYYQCDLAKIFKPFVKKGVVDAEAKLVTRYQVSTEFTGTLTPKQTEALARIRDRTRQYENAELTEVLGIKPHMVSALFKQGALEKCKVPVMRQAVELSQPIDGLPLSLAPEQQEIVERVLVEFEKPQRPFLLYGITGSGKTHVYIELTRAALARGRGVIILVPEISLTPQTIGRFKSALGDCIAVIHSRMSNGERRDSLHELSAGRKQVVIGVRSAILAPIHNIGLIIVDEEHDHSYKQSEPDPRYNARDVAVMRGNFQGALVLLGSATPSMESYHNALCGKYTLLTLDKRFGGAGLPQVKIVDMNEEHKANNWTFLSRDLHNLITKTLSNNRQIIILLNRRGFSTFLLCKACGYIYKCPFCSVNLTFHKTDDSLKCHICGFLEPAPTVCVKCRGDQIRFRGIGIQKAEEFIREQFPYAKILRMDQDTTRTKRSHIEILSAFAQRQADILIGTQMVAKGLNFPGVSLVGVLQADIGLHMPDFRAAEKTFQLLSQVAGRAGRTDDEGIVVIQTFSPQDPSILFAQKHDYASFFNAELEARRELLYPPFGKLARIVVEGPGLVFVQQKINEISSRITALSNGTITVLGPSPAVLERIKNVFRFAMLLKCTSSKHLHDVLDRTRAGLGNFPRSMKLVIDVDPLNML